MIWKKCWLNFLLMRVPSGQQLQKNQQEVRCVYNSEPPVMMHRLWFPHHSILFYSFQIECRVEYVQSKEVGKNSFEWMSCEEFNLLGKIVRFAAGSLWRNSSYLYESGYNYFLLSSYKLFYLKQFSWLLFFFNGKT